MAMAVIPAVPPPLILVSFLVLVLPALSAAAVSLAVIGSSVIVVPATGSVPCPTIVVAPGPAVAPAIAVSVSIVSAAFSIPTAVVRLVIRRP